MCDALHFASKSPVVGGTGFLQPRAVALARRKHPPLISWSTILIKAFALMSKNWPELRRAYMPLPWPHMYEHPHSVATLVIEREWHGSKAVFFDQIHAPEEKSLREIEVQILGMKRAKVESVGGFRRLIRITRYPLPVRRSIWRGALYGPGRLKSHYFGTYSLNMVGSRRSYTTQSLTLVAISFLYGPIERDGMMPIQAFFDHRVIDGANVNRLLVDLQATLDHDIVNELNQFG
jgi:hypothetical protein